MNELKIYTTSQSDKWDAIVRSFNDYDVYWLSGYVKAFEIHGDGIPLLFYYEDNSCRGINVVMKRDISKDIRFIGKVAENTWFDFVTPYGYGGWIIEGNDSKKLFKTYENWCKENNIVSEFVRYHPVLKNYIRTKNFYDVLSLGSTIVMDLSSPETIWANLTSKNRNMIRKAQKSGIVVYNGRYPEIFETFRRVYNNTMDRDKANPYYYFEKEFYASIITDLSSEAQVFYAELDGNIIAASIMIAARGHLNYHLSGSIREYQSLAPTNLLLYQAALWGYSNGCHTFHLGGGVGSHEDSLYKFKKAFYRGEPCRFHVGRKVHMKEQYREFVNMRSGLQEDRYFPKYRA